jgi:rod shape determining protein RodA
MLYAAVYDESDPFSFLDISTIIGKQTAWVAISLVVFTCTMVVDWKAWNTFAYPIYLIAMLLLVGVLLIGPEIKGARSWYSFGPVSFQPAEIAKFATALALSSFISYYKSNIETGRTLLVSLGIIFFPMLLIILQPDPGSALIFLSFFILLYRRGMSSFFFLLGFGLVVIFICSMIFGPMIVAIDVILIGFIALIFNHNKRLRNTLLSVGGVIFMTFLLYFINPYFALVLSSFALIVYFFIHIKERKFRMATLVGIGVSTAVLFGLGTNYAFNNFLKPHQQERINVWLRPDLCDPQGPLYNIIQSKMAIGSGGFQGKGFLNGNMTKLNYVPEQTTDFIFSTVGEEQGFIGTVGIIILFTILLIRITIIAERHRSPFVRNYGYCVAGIFFFQIFINIGMTMGLMPVIGIPLPFLSKGGSALIGFTLLLGTLIKMDMDR